MWLAGLLMSISDGCGGSVPDLSKLARERGQTNVWLANPPKLSRALEQLLADETTRAWLIGAVLGFVLVLVLVGFALFALHCWLETGFVRLHVNILEHASDDLAPLFTGRDRFRAMLGYNLLAGHVAARRRHDRGLAGRIARVLRVRDQAPPAGRMPGSRFA